jgi:hypothetical protein
MEPIRQASGGRRAAQRSNAGPLLRHDWLAHTRGTPGHSRCRLRRGRFTQIALETGADVVSFDLSLAIEAASRNNAGADRLCMFQASIY